MVTDVAVAFCWLLAWFTGCASAASLPSSRHPQQPWKQNNSYVLLSPPGSLSQGQHPAPGWWPAASLQLCSLAKILGLEFVFLPLGSTRTAGWDREQVDTALCMVGWVGATHCGTTQVRNESCLHQSLRVQGGATHT